MTIYFGENLKRLRKEKELTQETLAEFLGVSFQAVSKWERNESYPDITMLPAIASFFGTTTDELLGTDKTRQEEKIKSYLEKYDSLYLLDTPKTLRMMKKAVSEFPGDYRLLIRYFNLLIAEKGGIKEGLSIQSEVQSIYDRIDSFCTDDSIRIWSQRLMATYCKSMSRVESSSLGLEDMEKILQKMPEMHNSGDFAATYLYPPSEKHYKACQNAIEELLYLLNCVIVNYCYYDDIFTTEFKIEAIKTILSVNKSFYTDGNYGKLWANVIYNYGHLGYLNFQAGNIEDALKNLKICAQLAKKHDEEPDTVTSSSLLFNGAQFTKIKRGKTYCERMKGRMLNDYPLSDEFKQSDEFKEILKILE